MCQCYIRCLLNTKLAKELYQLRLFDVVSNKSVGILIEICPLSLCVCHPAAQQAAWVVCVKRAAGSAAFSAQPQVSMRQIRVFFYVGGQNEAPCFENVNMWINCWPFGNLSVKLSAGVKQNSLSPNRLTGTGTQTQRWAEIKSDFFLFVVIYINLKI